jgi:hypothetical protein
MIEVIILLIVLMLKFGPDLKSLSYYRLDDYLLRAEKRFGKLGWTAILAVVMLGAACVNTRLDTHCGYLGYHYARLAEDPFAFDSDNPVAFRILTPLISYAIGFRGCSIIITNLIISAIFIGIVYYTFRRTTSRPGDAFLGALAGTFSLVILTSIHCGGYCDILTYLIIYLMWLFRRKSVPFYFLFFLGLLNRESIAFLVPWFIFISLQASDRKGLCVIKVIIGYALTLSLYYLFREMAGMETDVKYSMAYYLRPLLSDPIRGFQITYYYHGLGFFSVYKALWVFPFAAVILFCKQRNFVSLSSMILVMFCAYAQLAVAQDTSRMLTLGFMIMFISLHHLFQTDFYRFRAWAFWAVLFNLLIPQVYTAGHKVEVWQSYLSHLISIYF